MQDEAESLETRRRQEERWERAVTVSVLAIIGSGILTFAVQEGSVKHQSFGMACIANLKTIDGAKGTWALETNKTTNDVHIDADLFGPTLYLREKPQCPKGGTYTLRRIDQKPRCSVPDHTI